MISSSAQQAAEWEVPETGDGVAAAYVRHHIPQRTRLHVPCRKRDEGYFSRVKDTLRRWEAVEDVITNPATGGVLVSYEGEVRDLADYARAHGLFELSGPRGRPKCLPAGELVWRHLDRLNRKIEQYTEGEEDLSSLAFVVLAGLGVLQLVRGNALPAATTLFGTALRAASASHRYVEARGGNARGQSVGA